MTASDGFHFLDSGGSGIDVGYIPPTFLTQDPTPDASIFTRVLDGADGITFVSKSEFHMFYMQFEASQHQMRQQLLFAQ